jgi:hypothetical protein
MHFVWRVLVTVGMTVTVSVFMSMRSVIVATVVRALRGGDSVVVSPTTDIRPSSVDLGMIVLVVVVRGMNLQKMNENKI